jgi:DNA modification methylase
MNYPDDYINKVICGDCLEIIRTLPDESVDCCITSPPYWGLRDYGVEGQLGLEKTPEEYVAKMVEIFREVKRVLKKEGTCWLNLGDSYCGSGDKGEKVDPKYPSGRNGQKIALNNKIMGLQPKNLVGIPWRVAFALQADGWYLRQDIIWAKPNPMPESVTDRCTKSHEYIFLLAKSIILITRR